MLVDATADLPLFRYLLDALPDGAPWRFRGHRYVGGIAEDLAAGRLTALLPEVEPKRDRFRLLWRSGHTREAELVALAEALRALPLR